MLEMTELAIEKLKAFQKIENKNQPVRIALVSGSSTGPNLGVSCDEQLESDVAFEFDDLLVIIDEPLINYCEKITVDFVKNEAAGCSAEGGFKIVPQNTL